MSGEVSLESFRLKGVEDLAVKIGESVPDNRRYPRKTRPKGEDFLRGPIPWCWICRASQLPGAALPVGLALWRMAFIKNNLAVHLTSTGLEALGVKPDAKLRALKALEKAGLVMVERAHGKNPAVTILDESREDLGEPAKLVKARRPGKAGRGTALIPLRGQAGCPSPAGCGVAVQAQGKPAKKAKARGARNLAQFPLPGVG